MAAVQDSRRVEAYAAYQQAQLLLAAGEAVTAESKAREALALWPPPERQAEWPEAVDEAEFQLFLGRLCDAGERYREAEQCARRAIIALDRLIWLVDDERRQHVLTLHLWSLQLLGNTLRAQGLLDEAEAALRQALQASFQFPGQPETIAQAYNDLAILYKKSDRLREAAEAYRRALQLCEAHPERAGQQALVALYANLGSLAQTMENPEEAQEWFAKAREAHRLQIAGS